MANYRIESEVYERYENFSHFIIENETNNAVIIDPAWDTEYFIERAKKLGVTPVAIWITHGHHDHVSAVDGVKDHFNIPVYASKVELDFINQYSADELPIAFRPLPKETIALTEGEILRFGEVEAKIWHTPGHSSGSICFELSDDLITGDTLFIDGCGRTDLVGSDPEAMFHSLEKIKREIDPKKRLHTGHAYGPSATDTLANQLKTNPFLQYDSVEEFIGYRMSR